MRSPRSASSPTPVRPGRVPPICYASGWRRSTFAMWTCGTRSTGWCRSASGEAADRVRQADRVETEAGPDAVGLGLSEELRWESEDLHGGPVLGVLGDGVGDRHADAAVADAVLGRDHDAMTGRVGDHGVVERMARADVPHGDVDPLGGECF